MDTRYLIWDFDGTLGYREGGMWSGTLLELMREALPELEVTAEVIRPHLTYPWHTPERPHPELRDADAWWEAMHPIFLRALTAAGVPQTQAPALAGQFRARYTDHARWRLFPDSIPTLARLSAAGWRHVVLSNHVPELPGILDHLGVTPHLAALFNSAETGYEKPHPFAFQQVLDFIGSVDAVWMIGDNPKADVAGAAAQGIPAILVRQPQAEAPLCCEDVSGVEEIVQGNRTESAPEQETLL